MVITMKTIIFLAAVVAFSLSGLAVENQGRLSCQSTGNQVSKSHEQSSPAPSSLPMLANEPEWREFSFTAGFGLSIFFFAHRAGRWADKPIPKKH